MKAVDTFARKNITLSVFRVEGGVTPTSNRKQIHDIGAEVARNGKVKKSEFYPPPKKKLCKGKVLPKLKRGNRQQNIV